MLGKPETLLILVRVVRNAPVPIIQSAAGSALGVPHRRSPRSEVRHVRTEPACRPWSAPYPAKPDSWWIRPRNRSVPFMQSARLPRSSSCANSSLYSARFERYLVNEPLGIEHTDVSRALPPARSRTAHRPCPPRQPPPPRRSTSSILRPVSSQAFEQGRTGN